MTGPDVHDNPADLNARLRKLQMADDPAAMVLDDVEPIDEKSEVTLIKPDDAVDEHDAEPEVESAPVASDYEAMKSRVLPELPDLEISHEAVSTWELSDWKSLKQKTRGPKFMCGDFPWRILLFPYGNNVDFASLYLEQGWDDAEGGTKPPEGWYACVQFTLVLWNKNDPSMYITHIAQHRFTAEESDWGFTRFAELRKLIAPSWENRGKPMIENDAANITAYVRIYKDPTGVLWHNWMNYNSKKETGMVGLKNQGATCYLNSLLQSLYFTDAFRKAVYQVPTDTEADRGKSAWALQRLFFQLQTNEDAVSTQQLTHSFGWETRHIFEQQDVQELSRILMEKMEERMKGTGAENALAKMFSGKMKTYISCINVDYESSRVEDFWDIQLNVSGNKNLDDSFRDYIQVETMDGENKYFAEGFGLQDAKKGVIFESFPQVLHLQLKRFEYDMHRDAMMKVNDRHEFPETFDAAPYLSDTADKSEPYIYQLHGVLVHSGDFNAGHYYAFLRPEANGHFYKFDDDRVTRATIKEALEENYGGDYANKTNGNAAVRNPYTRTLSTKRSMSAYMLVYIRQSRVHEVLQEVTEEDTPSHIAKQLYEEKAAIERQRKEREEQHLYLNLTIFTKAMFLAHQGFDLASTDLEGDSQSTPTHYRVLRASTIQDLTNTISEDLKIPPERIRLWVMVNRQNKTTRPDQPIRDSEITLETAYQKHGVRDKGFRLWVEEADTFEDGQTTWPETQLAGGVNANGPLLIFLKYFDAEAQTLKGAGYVYLKKQQKVSELIPHIRRIMGWSSNDPLLTNGTEKDSDSDAPSIALFEEIKHSMIDAIRTNLTLQQAELQDGDIICFQKILPKEKLEAIDAAGGYTQATEFYDHLLNRLLVSFSPRVATENEADLFKLELSRKMVYDQFSAKVGEHLKVDPTHLRFSTINATTGKVKAIVRRTAHQNLYQILNAQTGQYGSSNQRDDALMYEVLDMSLSELDTKRTMRITWISEGITKEETFDILVSKTGTIRDLLTGLREKARLDEDTIKRVQVFETQHNRFHRIWHDESLVQSISEFVNLYAQAIPAEETNAGDDERLIDVFHFDKEPAKTHGVPFRLVMKPGEPFKETKERISQRTGLKGKLLERLKFAMVPRSLYSKPQYLEDDDVIFDLASQTESASLGIDHINRNKGSGGKDSIFIR